MAKRWECGSDVAVTLPLQRRRRIDKIDWMPRVAVVIPALNPGTYLLESIESVRAQTFTDIEIVVVDDGSKPETMPELPGDSRITVVQQANEGVSVARNRGVAHTTAPLIAFLDADDRWFPNKLELQLDALERRPEAVVCYTDFVHIAPDGRRLGRGNGSRVDTYDDLLRGCSVPLSSSMVRRDAFDAAGRFDPFYLIVQDWDLWLRLIRVGPFVFVDEPLMEYRVANHNIGQLSGDPQRAFYESMSVLDRQELIALRSNDKITRELVKAGRRSTRRMRARQAAARFVDSVGLDNEWPMLWAAVSIDVPAASVEIAARSLRRCGKRLRQTLRTGKASL